VVVACEVVVDCGFMVPGTAGGVVGVVAFGVADEGAGAAGGAEVVG
jgi:hypothetical protein